MDALLHLVHNDHGELSAVAAFFAGGLPAIRAALWQLLNTRTSGTKPEGV
jgi:hypothetical protein